MLRNAVGKKVQAAAGGDARIELAQAAGGGVARVGKRFLALGFLACIERGKIGFQHQHFAAHFDGFGHIAAVQAQRNIGDGAHIVGNVFAAGTIAAGGRLHQHAASIEQADGQAVEFRFNHIFGLLPGQAAAHAFIKSEHFAVVKCAGLVLRRKSIAQREHGHGMHHAGKTGQGCAAHAAGGAFGQAQIGMRRFERFELAKQNIVFGIGHAGRIKRVILISVAVERVGELADAAGGIVCHLELGRLKMWGRFQTALFRFRPSETFLVILV